MRRLILAIAALLVLQPAAAADTPVFSSQDFQSTFRVKNLPAPGSDGEPLRRGDMPSNGLPCAIVFTGSSPLFRCAIPGDLPGITSLTGGGTATGPGAATLTLHLDGGTTVQGLLPLTNLASGGAATGQLIGWNGIAWTPTTFNLPFIAPAQNYGGDGIAGVQVDSFGRVLSATPRTFVTPATSLGVDGDVAGVGPVVGPLHLTLQQNGASDGQVYTWVASSNAWLPRSLPAGGITQLTSDVIAGPGSGSQVATIASGAVTNAKLSLTHTGYSLMGNIASGTGGISDIPLTTAWQVPTYDGSTFGFHTLAPTSLTGWPTGIQKWTGSAMVAATIQATGTSGGGDVQGPGAYVTSGTGPVTFSGPGAAATALNLAGGSISGVLPAANLGSFTAGSVLYWNGGLAQDNANHFWDSANGRLGIGTNAPSVRLHLKGTLTSNAKLYVENTAAGASDYTEFGIISSAGVGSRASIYLTSPAYTGIDGANALTLQAATSGTINMFTGTGTTMALTVTNNGASAGSIRIPSLSAGGMARAAATTGQLSIAIAQASGATTAGADYQGPGAYVTSGTGPVTFSGPGAAATSLNLAGGSVSGALPCGSLPSLIGDLTNSGCTLTLWPNIVTFAKFQQLAANSLMMNPTASTANAQAVSLGGTAGLTEWVPGAPGTFNVYAAGSGRIPRGSGTSGQLTDGADLVFSPSAEQLQLVYSIATGTNGLLLNNTSAGTGAITDLRFRNDTSKLAEIYLTSSTYAGTESAPSALTVTTGAGQSFIVSPNNGPQLKVSTVGIEHIADTYLDSILSAGYLSTGAGGKVTGNAWPAAGMLTGASGSLTGISFGANQIAYGSGTSGQLTSSSALQWSPTSTQLQLSYSHATGTNGILLNNTSSGTSAFTDLRFQNDAGKLAEIYLPSSTYTGTETGPSDLTIATNSSTQAVYVSPNGTPELKISNIGTETLGDTYLDTVLGAGYLSTAAGGKIVGNAWPTSGQIVYISGSNAVGSANLTFTGTNLILGGDVKVGGISPSTLVATDTGDFLASVTVDPSLSFASNTLSLPAVATAGTYGASVNVIRSITIDSKGRTTAISTSNKPQSFAVTWAMNQTGMSMGQDRSQLLFPGMAAAPLATQSNTAGSAVATTMAAFWGTSNSPPTIPLRDGYNGVSMSVDVPIVVGSGSSTATLAFSLFEVSTSPSTAANYTPICTAFSPTLATGAQSSFQTIGCTGSASASNSSLVLVVYRSDVNGLYTLTSLQFQAIATIWATP